MDSKDFTDRFQVWWVGVCSADVGEGGRGELGRRLQVSPPEPEVSPRSPPPPPACLVGQSKSNLYTAAMHCLRGFVSAVMCWVNALLRPVAPLTSTKRGGGRSQRWTHELWGGGNLCTLHNKYLDLYWTTNTSKYISQQSLHKIYWTTNTSKYTPQQIIHKIYWTNTGSNKKAL